MIRIFPIHAAILEDAYLQIMNRRITREVERVFLEVCANRLTTDEGHLQFLKLANILEHNNEQQYYISKYLAELQIIETCGERELQLVIQTTLFIYSRFFPRISILFSESFGMDIRLVFAINWAFTIFSITKSVISYRNAKRYPMAPGIVGKVVQPLSVASLVTFKVLFVSIATSNAPYFHIIGHVIKISISCLIVKAFGNSLLNFFNVVISTSNCAAFFTHEEIAETLVSKKSQKRLQGKGGNFMIILLLEGASYLIYGSLGCLIRYLQQINLINSSNIPIRSYDEDPIQYILRSLLVHFELRWILFLLASSFWIFAVFYYFYYQNGHPKKSAIYEHEISKDLEALSRKMAQLEEGQEHSPRISKVNVNIVVNPS